MDDLLDPTGGGQLPSFLSGPDTVKQVDISVDRLLHTPTSSSPKAPHIACPTQPPDEEWRPWNEPDSEVSCPRTGCGQGLDMIVPTGTGAGWS